MNAVFSPSTIANGRPLAPAPMADALNPRELLPGFIDPLQIPRLPDSERGGWAVDTGTIKLHRDALVKVSHLEFRQPETAEGRGILTVGGGKYWPGIVVMCRLLRDLGCQYPVEVWYRGQCEPVNPADVVGLNVKLIDLDAMARDLGDTRIPQGNVARGGWEAKLYALTHTTLETVVYLDADAYFVSSPDPLFDLADEHGFAWWEDLPYTDKHVHWSVVWPAGNKGIAPVQGGQLGINRRKAWRMLSVAHWMNQHSDFYYSYMFGDQDTYRVALAATGGANKNIGKAPWINGSVAFVCPLNGNPAVVHRCQGKLFRPHEIKPGDSRCSNPDYNLPGETQVFHHFAALMRAEQARTGQTAAEIFRECYERRLWGDGSSGAGSSNHEAAPYIAAVNGMAAIAGWKSAVDVGCGDGRVAKELKFPEFTGVDVFPLIVHNNKALQPNRRWEVIDFYEERERLPAADVLLCKDVLHHWPNTMVTEFMRFVKTAGKWKYAVFAQDVHQRFDGQNTFVGGYRALHPDQSPLNEFRFEAVIPFLHKALLLLKCD
jgi:SAM-dependent methyltransferase